MIAAAAVALAALLGFTAHRAGICAVKAVGEVITTGRAHMLTSFGKTVLWVMAVMLPLTWLAPGHTSPMLLWLSPASLVGAALFGIGAAINGGCAISTVTRLGNGELGMLMTIGGIAAMLGIIDGGLLIPPAMPSGTPMSLFTMAGWPLAVTVTVLWAWACYEAVRLWRRRDSDGASIDRLLHRRWRLSTAAAIIGLANAVIALIAGHWAYTGTLRQAIRSVATGTMPPAALAVGLFGALFGGIVVSALLRGSFHLRWRPTPGWLRHLGGGLLMGYGVATVPGGNDALVLDALPSLSPHATPAFAALLGGITVGLLALSRLEPLPRIDCGSDLCAEDPAPGSQIATRD